MIAFNPERRDNLTASNVGQDEKFELAAEWVKEMNPSWERERVDAYVQNRIAYTIPEVESGQYDSYESFRDATMRSKLENEFPDIDFDEAREFSQTEKGEQIYKQYMEMLGSGNLDIDIMNTSEMKMLRAYKLTEAGMLDFPEPETPQAHALEVSNLRELQSEYNDFKHQRAMLGNETLNVAPMAQIQM